MRVSIPPFYNGIRCVIRRGIAVAIIGGRELGRGGKGEGAGGGEGNRPGGEKNWGGLLVFEATSMRKRGR